MLLSVQLFTDFKIKVWRSRRHFWAQAITISHPNSKKNLVQKLIPFCQKLKDSKLGIKILCQDHLTTTNIKGGKNNHLTLNLVSES
jgi:hypothetical protein